MIGAVTTGSGRALPAEDIVLERYGHNIYAHRMASSFGGRHWTSSDATMGP
jgi:hypothetical protein